MRKSRHFGTTTVFVSLMWVSVVVTGCSPILETEYGATRGRSINGISSFVDLLRKSGRKVDVWSCVSPRMEYQYQALIVFVSSNDRLSEKFCRDTQEMLMDGAIEKLIVVVRDSDAAIDYWRQIHDRSDLSPKEIAEAGASYDSRLKSFRTDSISEFDSKPETWYGLKRVDRTADSPTKSIECQAAEGPVAIEARWPLNRRLQSSDSAEVLWKSGDDPLLTSEEFDYGTIVVMGSATPLLNGSLVDPGNRRLAEEFIRHVPSDDRVAVAASSRWLDHSELESPGLLKFLKVHPNGWVFGQGIVALLLFCWWKFPIFGRPRRSISTETVRFGRHVEALGNLLRRSKDVKYAQQRIRDWQGTQKPRSDLDLPNDFKQDTDCGTASRIWRSP